MQKLYLGIDIGSISTKAVIIDEENNIVASSYLYTEGNPINATKRVLTELKSRIDLNKSKIVSVGTTGSARKLIGVITGAKTIKNEITAHAIGTLAINPKVRTILEIGGQDSKIILINNGIVTDYAMNSLCAAGTGAFLSSQASRLKVKVEDFGDIALTSKNPTNIASRCTVFAESDLVHKIQVGHTKRDIIAGLCKAVVNNYLSNVAKGKKILEPIFFQGGVSKNKAVKYFFEQELKTKVYVNKNSHLTGALGIAILSKQKLTEFDFNITDITYETKSHACTGCPNHCEVIKVIKDNIILDSWGNRCERGEVKV